MKKPMFLAAMAAGALMMCNSALAQTDNTMNQMDSTTVSSRFGVGDMMFLNDVMRANAKEIVFGQLAMRKAGDRSVYNYAQRMRDDHMMVADKIRGWMTAENGWNTLWMSERRWNKDRMHRMGDWESYKSRYNMGQATTPDQGMKSDTWADATTDWASWLTADDMQTYSSLEKLNGARFDKAYIECMVKDHYKVLKAWDMQFDRTSNDNVRGLIRDHIDTIRNHHDEAMRISYNYDDPFNLHRSWPW